MQFIIESSGLPLDNRVVDLVQSKFEILEKIYDRVKNCLVVVKNENDDQKKDFQVKAHLAVSQKSMLKVRPKPSKKLCIRWLTTNTSTSTV